MLIFLAAASAVIAPGAEAGMALIGKNAVRDCAGRQIRMEKPFSRIISLYGAHTENLFSLGLTAEIIGVGRNPAYPPQARQKPAFSPHDGPEKFLAARPDLVLVRPMIDRGYPDLMARLEAFGIRVVSLQPGSVKEMKTYWQILGRLTGREHAAADMIAKFEKGAARAREFAARVPGKKTVYFEAFHDRFKTFAPGAMPLFALKCAGGKNAARGVQPVRGTNIAAFGKERIMALGPQIDVYLAQKGPMNAVTVRRIASEPGFGVIRAVRNGEIYIVDEQIVSRPTLRLLNGICRIGEILYPEIFTPQAKRTVLQPIENRKAGN